jgi:hypothetical protein
MFARLEKIITYFKEGTSRNNIQKQHQETGFLAAALLGSIMSACG